MSLSFSHSHAHLSKDSISWKLEGCEVASKDGYHGLFWNDQISIMNGEGRLIFTRIRNDKAVNQERFEVTMGLHPFITDRPGAHISRFTHIYSTENQLILLGVPYYIGEEPECLNMTKLKAVDGWRAPWQEVSDHIALDTQLGTIRIHELDEDEFISKPPWRGLVLSSCPMHLAKVLKDFYLSEMEKRKESYNSELESLR